MKTQLKNKLMTLSLCALSLAFAGKALANPVELDSKDFLRVNIPLESAESARFVYGSEGDKAEISLKDGDVIELHAELDLGNGPLLGNFSFLGFKDEVGNNTIVIESTNPIGYAVVLENKTSGESFAVDTAINLVVEATDASLEVVQAGGLDEIQQPGEKIFFGEVAQDFYQKGVMDIRFVVEQPADDNNGDDQNDDGADNNENQPQAEASGGCSMTANATGSAMNLLALAPMAGLALAFRRRK